MGNIDYKVRFQTIGNDPEVGKTGVVEGRDEVRDMEMGKYGISGR